MSEYTATVTAFTLGIVGLIFLIPIVIFVITLVSIVQSPNWTPAFKALWVLAAIPTGIVGLICWFVWGKKEGNILPAQPYPGVAPDPTHYDPPSFPQTPEV